MVARMANEQADIEASVRALSEAGDHRSAATVALEAYGPSIYSFLTAFFRSPTRAEDVFSQFCEDFWQGLPGFEWRCTVRAWAFTLARHAALSHVRRADQRRERNLPLSEAKAISDRIRTETAPYKQTAIKDRMRSLRERLTEEEQTILILRVDKKLSWTEVGRVLAGHDEDGEASEKSSARIRKRFQLIKEKLRKWAIEDGLLPKTDD